MISFELDFYLLLLLSPAEYLEFINSHQFILRHFLNEQELSLMDSFPLSLAFISELTNNNNVYVDNFPTSIYQHPNINSKIDSFYHSMLITKHSKNLSTYSFDKFYLNSWIEFKYKPKGDLLENFFMDWVKNFSSLNKGKVVKIQNLDKIISSIHYIPYNPHSSVYIHNVAKSNLPTINDEVRKILSVYTEDFYYHSYYWKWQLYAKDIIVKIWSEPTYVSSQLQYVVPKPIPSNNFQPIVEYISRKKINVAELHDAMDNFYRADPSTKPIVEGINVYIDNIKYSEVFTRKPNEYHLLALKDHMDYLGGLSQEPTEEERELKIVIVKDILDEFPDHPYNYI